MGLLVKRYVMRVASAFGAIAESVIGGCVVNVAVMIYKHECVTANIRACNISEPLTP